MKRYLIILAFLPLISWGQTGLGTFNGGLWTFQGGSVTYTPSPYNSDADALFKRMSVQPTDDEKWVYSDAFDSLQSNNLYNKIYAYWSMGVHDEQAAKLNWINSSYTITNIGTMFNDYFGFEGDGTTSYLNTNLTPNTVTIPSLFLDNCTFAVSIDSISDAHNEYHGVSDGSSDLFLIPRLGTSSYTRVNATNNTIFANNFINAIFTGTRNNNTEQRLYENSRNITTSISSAAVPTLSMYLLARNSSGTAVNYSDNNMNAAYVAEGFDSIEVVKMNEIINGFNTRMRAASPIVWGVSPSYAPEINTQNLQANIDSGNATKSILNIGTYGLSSSVFMDDNTTLNFADNVIMQKQAVYSNVFLNRGALTKTYNENIEINGLTLSVNGNETPGEWVDGLDGHLGFFYIKDLIIRDFYCDDVGTNQFTIQASKWENLLYDDIYIEGDKDALDFYTGHGADIRNCTIKTFDDAIFIGGNQFAARQTEAIGDVYDMTFTNINYIDSSKTRNARGTIFYTATWADWLNGNQYQTGDFSLNSSIIYQCDNGTGFSGIGTTEPIHTSGSVTGADGITWRFIDTGSYYATNVYDITIDSSFFYNPSGLINNANITNSFVRTHYPGTETNSWVRNITVKNTTLATANILNNRVNFDTLKLYNNVFDSADVAFFYVPDVITGIDSLVIISDNNEYNYDSDSLVFNRGQYLYFESTNDVTNNDSLNVISNNGGELRMNNQTLLIASDKSEITPVLNDTVLFTDGLYYWNGASWDLIP